MYTFSAHKNILIKQLNSMHVRMFLCVGELIKVFVMRVEQEQLYLVRSIASSGYQSNLIQSTYGKQHWRTKNWIRRITLIVTFPG